MTELAHSIPNANILVVEDVDLIKILLEQRIKEHGYRALSCASGREALSIHHDDNIDLILLDLGLPDEEGLVILRQIKARSHTPVVILTANEDTSTRLAALEIGADDYLTKSVSPEELMLRIRNILGRKSNHQPHPANMHVRIGEWTYDASAQTVWSHTGETANLTASELRVLMALTRAPKRVLSRDDILDAIAMDGDAPSLRMIDSYVSRLRKKLGAPKEIGTVPGMGYRYTPSS